MKHSNKKAVETFRADSKFDKSEETTEPNYRRDRKQRTITPRKAEFQCYICKYEPKNYRMLERHIEQHVAARDQKCEICDEQLTSNELKVHLCGTETDLKCEYCTQSFNVTSEILQHLKDDHDSKLLYKCEKCRRCTRFFGMKYLRDLHERLQKEDSENRPFVCGICFKRYKHKSYRDDHMLKHSGESESVSIEIFSRF